MKDKYTAATVFLDHQSDLAFIHMQKNQTSNEIFKAKLEFEAFAKTIGVQVQAYHADNGRFAENFL